MKLNLNCIRDSLLCLEEHLLIENNDGDLELITVDMYELHELLEGRYSLEEVAYTLLKTEEAGLITAAFNYASDCLDEAVVCSITYNGHQFLEAIRPKTVWEKICSAISKIGIGSIHTVLEISKALLPDLIESALSH
ncbi:MAG: DUF2513 domain-containing protein [Lachnospiraceae bacterium]|jgi:hypothetical protein|nr:DUF2513 domain-containing protein [Lachnospiraceae bacterium]